MSSYGAGKGTGKEKSGGSGTKNLGRRTTTHGSAVGPQARGKTKVVGKTQGKPTKSGGH